MTTFLSTEDVCGKLTAAGVDTATVGKVFAARLQPKNLDDPDKKFVLGVPSPSGQAFLVVYEFGLGTPLAKASPLDEGGPDYRPRWISVEGPFTVAEAIEKAKELTSA